MDLGGVRVWLLEVLLTRCMAELYEFTRKRMHAAGSGMALTIPYGSCSTLHMASFRNSACFLAGMWWVSVCAIYSPEAAVYARQHEEKV